MTAGSSFGLAGTSTAGVVASCLGAAAGVCAEVVAMRPRARAPGMNLRIIWLVWWESAESRQAIPPCPERVFGEIQRCSTRRFLQTNDGL